MIRDSRGNLEYWEEWIEHAKSRVVKTALQLSQPSGNPAYRPQYVYDIARGHWEDILRQYSAGREIRTLSSQFEALIDRWETSVELGKSVYSEERQYTRNAWKVNLDHYIVCFWLVGLALALNLSEELWLRLLALIGNEGEDKLLDMIIASRQPNRAIGDALCHPKPYSRLLAAIEASPADQPTLLLEFINHWHSELDRPAKKGNAPATAMYERPYWHRFGDDNFEGGAYFGRWCVEAIAAVKVFDLDDSLCLGHPNYPGDLLRPDGPSTHPPREDNQDPSTSKSSSQGGLLSKIFGKFKR
ncbi:PoNe immunity protein domain-containing protein [Amantichitinum ursilacus]|uniref:PoNi C-terminal domain-containing protein n=1 Tax=Amantichitinum ursilacus TaxID=857265 RepID=A0A0N1JS95_9NEIS|nr:PoNe immunity protein domain-containing protein [Amantichitinum ursilacus]KPC51077.1 hypothetical protein WG78_15715 [Amantichitinum ursilacus]